MEICVNDCDTRFESFLRHNRSIGSTECISQLGRKSTQGLFKDWLERHGSDSVETAGKLRENDVLNAGADAKKKAKSAPLRSSAAFFAQWRIADQEALKSEDKIAGPAAAALHIADASPHTIDASATPILADSTSAAAAATVADTHLHTLEETADVLYNWQSLSILPKIHERAAQLSLAASDQGLSFVDNIAIWDALREHDQKFNSSLERTALEAILILRNVNRPIHAHHAHRVSAVRYDAAKRYPLVNDAIYFTAWQRLWDLGGEGVQMEAAPAKKLLEYLLNEEPPFTGSSGQTKIQLRKPNTRSLRHLLFLAGINDNPVLALDLFTHVCFPYFLTKPAHTVTAPETSDPSGASDGAVEFGESFRNDMSLILHDVLRSGIIPSFLLQRSQLLALISKRESVFSRVASSFSATPLEAAASGTQVLHQTLLRIIITCYSETYRAHERATLLLRLLEPVPQTDASVDAAIFIDVCTSALNASAIDGRWVGRVAGSLILALTGKVHLQTGGSSMSSPPVDEQWRQLLRLFFDTALPEGALGKRVRASSASLVWKALSCALPHGEVAGLRVLSASQLAHLARSAVGPYRATRGDTVDSSSGSDSTDPLSPSADLAVLIKVTLHSVQQQSLFSACTEGSANYLLQELLFALHTTRKRISQQSLGDMLADLREIYQIFKHSGFTPNTRNLVPLADLMRSKSNSKAVDPDSRSVIDSFLTERSNRADLDPCQMTSVLRACIVNHDAQGAADVLELLLRQRLTPSLADLGIILSVIASGSPRLALKWINQMLKAGMTGDSKLWRSIYQAFPQGGDDSATLLDMLSNKSDHVFGQASRAV
ncbi:hypothetical protein EMMF5_000700 [Cystobasidiomycetes sp. EMM_F5]